MIFRTRYEIHV